MISISINLLPGESALIKRQHEKFKLIQGVSTVILLLFIFLSSLLIALRIMQSKDLNNVQVQANDAESKIANFKDKEAAIVVLKNRLDLLAKVKVSSKQTAVYNEMVTLIPDSILISSLSVDKTGSIVLSMIVPDSQTLNTLLNNLTKDLNKFTKVDIDSLSRARDGVYRVNIKITGVK